MISKRVTWDSDWLQDMILYFIGHPFVGSSKWKIATGPRTLLVRIEKDAPGQATFNQICKAVGKRARNDADRKMVYRRLKNLRDLGLIKIIKRGIYKITEEGKDFWSELKDIHDANVVLKHEGDVCFHYNPQKKSLTVHAVTFDPALVEPIWDYFREKMKKMKGKYPESIYFPGESGIMESLPQLLFYIIEKYLKSENKRISRDSLIKLTELLEKKMEYRLDYLYPNPQFF